MAIDDAFRCIRDKNLIDHSPLNDEVEDNSNSSKSSDKDISPTYTQAPLDYDLLEKEQARRPSQRDQLGGQLTNGQQSRLFSRVRNPNPSAFSYIPTQRWNYSSESCHQMDIYLTPN